MVLVAKGSHLVTKEIKETWSWRPDPIIYDIVERPKDVKKDLKVLNKHLSSPFLFLYWLVQLCEPSNQINGV